MAGYADFIDMKRYSLVLLCTAFMLAACAGQKGKIIFYPDPGQDKQPDPIYPLKSWQIIESENGLGETEIPEWVRSYFDGEARRVESLDQYGGKYVFIGENWGENLNALQQWASNFTTLHDLPRLIAARVERRLVSAASLYPDDEYGQYFENLIKKVSDGEYHGAVKEQTFWVKRELTGGIAEDIDDAEPEQMETATELYEYLILISIDNSTLQSQLRQIMRDIKTTVPPTREQTIAITRIQQTFFEGF